MKPSYDELEKRVVELQHLIDKQIQTAKQSNELFIDYYHRLYDKSPDGFACFKMEYPDEQSYDIVFISVNTAFYQITGLDNVAGKRASEVFNNVDKQYVDAFQIYKTVATSGEPQKLEIYFEPLDIWLSISVSSPQKDYIIAVFEDITSKKNTEKALKESNELLALFIKNSPIYAFIKEVNQNESKVIYASENYIDMIGISGTNMIGKNMYELFPPEFAQKITADDFEVIKNGVMLKLEEDLNERNYNTYKFPITLGNKKLLAGYTIEITEERTAQNSLKESEERFRVIIESSTSGNIIYHHEGQCIYANKAASILIGGTTEELLSQNFRQIDNWAQSGLLEAADKCLATNQVVKLEVHSTTSFNIVVWNECHFIPISINHIPHILLMITDIKEMRMSVAALKQSEKNLKEINDSKDKLFSIIAHDLKNPLGAFKQLTQNLVDMYHEFTEQERIEFLELLKKYSKNIFSLLENLLEWSRSQRGIIEYNPQSINIYEFINTNIKQLSQLAENKNIEIDLIKGSYTFVIADPYLLTTIIRNLLSNAIKFTMKSGKIEIGTFKDEDYWGIYVSDNGIGMTQEVIEKLFRIDSHLTTMGTAKEQGTGLGLLLCKEFVDIHGGQIWVESKPSFGSTFKFTIPIVK